MSRTRKYCGDGGWERGTKFHYRQKKISDARDREFLEYCTWDAPRLCGEALMPLKIARKLFNKGWSEEKVIRHLRKKYSITQCQARDLLPLDIRMNNNWTNKPI